MSKHNFSMWLWVCEWHDINCNFYRVAYCFRFFSPGPTFSAILDLNHILKINIQTIGKRVKDKQRLWVLILMWSLKQLLPMFSHAIVTWSFRCCSCFGTSSSSRSKTNNKGRKGRAQMTSHRKWHEAHHHDSNPDTVPLKSPRSRSPSWVVISHTRHDYV